MASRLIHPRMLETLQRDFFPQSCRIEQPPATQDEFGQEEAEDGATAWSAVLGMDVIPCRLALASGGRRATAEMTVLNATHVIMLAGNYSPTTKMRAVVDGQIYRIELVSHDAEGILTRLAVRIVE